MELNLQWRKTFNLIKKRWKKQLEGWIKWMLFGLIAISNLLIDARWKTPNFAFKPMPQMYGMNALVNRNWIYNWSQVGCFLGLCMWWWSTDDFFLHLFVWIFSLVWPVRNWMYVQVLKHFDWLIESSVWWECWNANPHKSTIKTQSAELIVHARIRGKCIH